MSQSIADVLACPRCDSPLADASGDRFGCEACDIAYPSLEGMPWLFADPGASMGEWRNRLHFAIQKIAHDAANLRGEEDTADLRPLTRRRLIRFRKCLDAHRRKLGDLLAPLEVGAQSANYESHVALRTRLPVDQGLNTYYSNIHRDWGWGDEENRKSLAQIGSVITASAELGDVLVLGSGAGRLAYDMHMQLDCSRTVAFDFNPMLMLVARAVTRGETLSMYEFPIAPRSYEDDAVLRKLTAPEPVRQGFHLALGDALHPPFLAGSFDTVVTPWLIDIVTEEFSVFASRINRLLKQDGRWINFGSLAFHHPRRALRYSPEEVRTIVGESGFNDPYVSETTIPYMCSPASRHGRMEKVFTFSAYKEKDIDAPTRHTALPDWLVSGQEPVPLLQSFRTQAMTTQIYSFIMSLIDGKRSIEDMAVVLEKQRLMTREEAVPAIRSFLTRMVDDANRQASF